MPTLDTSYELNNPPVIADMVDGEAIAIDLESGVYYSLAGAAGGVWRDLVAGATPRSLLDGDSDAAALERFVAALLEHALLRPRADAADVEPAGVWDGSSLSFDRFTDMEDLLALDPIHGVDETFGWPGAPGT